ncbi:MAG: HEAT repeat domain-containing protein [Verrucomicrobia bacterium]|nr:HEAT repeat domain-containing protein [Verrucomicrobiota bacterium]
MSYLRQNEIAKTLLTLLVGVLGMANLAAIELDEIAHQIEVTAVEMKGRANPFSVDASTAKQIEKEEALMVAILKLGSPAIPYLLPLLQHKNKHVRALTMRILANIEGLKEEHLDALMISKTDESRRPLSNALARIGTPRSIGFLMGMLKKDEVGSVNYEYAFMILGAKGVPYIIDLFREEPTDEIVLRNAQCLLDVLEDEAASAVEPLIEIISDKSLPKDNRRFAILALGSFAKKSHAAVPLLQELAREDPGSFESAVETAIMRMEAPEALGIHVKQLHEDPEILSFRAIASFGEHGKSVGSALVQYLNYKDWDVKIGAVAALGYIEYDQASPSLIEVLENKNDWRLVYVAAESLGRIGAKDSVRALTKVSLSHWYPPVRDVAKGVVEVIRSNAVYKPKNSSSNPSMDFFDYVYAGRELGKPSAVENKRQSAKGSLNEKELKKLVYEIETHYYGSEGKMIRKRKQIPETGIKVEDGYLVGASRGEWGGELMFIDGNGAFTKILDDNIQGIYHTTSGIVVVAGIAHLSFNRGMLYKVIKKADGKWAAVKWRALPGVPRSSDLRENGDLFIGSPFGSVLVSPDGSIRMADGY